jgi:catechol 2,3-dioxygenase-like lactoylglutathione lyase family enzyme
VSEPLLSGINHVALAAADVDATVAFYQEVFDLEPTELPLPGGRSVFLFFASGSFVQVCDSSSPSVTAPRSTEPGQLLYDGAPLDHFSLFASDTDALEAIRARLVAHGASDGVVHDTAGLAKTVRFTDPDGRELEVLAYVQAG